MWGRENFVLFFSPPPKYFGASDTCHRLSFPVTMCKKKMRILSFLPEVREFITRHTAYNKHDTGWAKGASLTRARATPPRRALWCRPR